MWCNTEFSSLIFGLRVSSIVTSLVSARTYLDWVFGRVDQSSVLCVVCWEEALSEWSLDFVGLFTVFISTTLTVCIYLVVSLLGVLVKALVNMMLVMELRFSYNFRLEVFWVSSIIVSWIALLILVFKRCDARVSLVIDPVPGIVVAEPGDFGGTRIEHAVVATLIFVYIY